MVHLEQNEIMRRFREGDRQAFNFIHDSYSKGLKYFAKNITGNEQDAEDIVQHTMEKLWNNRDKLDKWDHVRNWLYRTAHNEATDYLKRKSVAGKASNELTYLNSSIEVQVDAHKTQASLLGNIYEQLNMEIDKLPPIQQQTIRLHFFEQQTPEEIAVRLNVKYQTVINNKNKALRSLRRKLPVDIRDLFPLLLALSASLLLFANQQN
jgi:RNA polymerase sigma-70 factor (ECF subfamily)